MEHFREHGGGPNQRPGVDEELHDLRVGVVGRYARRGAHDLPYPEAQVPILVDDGLLRSHELQRLRLWA